MYSCRLANYCPIAGVPYCSVYFAFFFCCSSNYLRERITGHFESKSPMRNPASSKTF